jgi:subtilisin family serine protease
MSFGGGYEPLVEAAFKNISSRRNDVLYFAASGNSGTEALSYPASCDGVISVAATNALGEVAGFSTSSAVVDLAAPGEAIISTIPLAFTVNDTYYTRYGDYHGCKAWCLAMYAHCLSLDLIHIAAKATATQVASLTCLPLPFL